MRENFAAHILLAICPDVNTNVLNFFGKQRTITTSEVMEYVERNSSSTPVNTTSSFFPAATRCWDSNVWFQASPKRFNLYEGKNLLRVWPKAHAVSMSNFEETSA